MLTKILTAVLGALFGWIDRRITLWRAEQARKKAEALEQALRSMDAAHRFEGRVERMNQNYEQEREKERTLREKLEYLKKFNEKTR